MSSVLAKSARAETILSVSSPLETCTSKKCRSRIARWLSAGSAQAGALLQGSAQHPVDELAERQAARLPHLLEIGRGGQAGDCVDLVEQDLAGRRVEEVHPGEALSRDRRER